MKNRKLLLLLIPLVPAALVAAVAGAAMLLPAERIGALAADRASAILDREVRVTRASIRVLPRPAVVLEDLAIAGRHSEGKPIATVRRVLLRPRILPLLARRVVVDAVVLDRPWILARIDPAGIVDLPVPDPAERGAAEPGGGDAAFLIRRFEIIDGRIAFRDERTGSTLRLDGVNQRLRLAGDLSAGELRRIELEGEIAIDSLGADLPDKLAVPVRGIRLEVEHHALLDRAADSLAIARLAVRVQELSLEGAGVVRGLSTPESRTTTLRLGAGPVDLGELVRSLPPALLAKVVGGNGAELPTADGTARIDVAIRGRLGGGEVPAVDGTMTLERFGLGYADTGELIGGLDGRIAFSLDSVATTGLTGRLLGEPLRLAFTVRDPAAPVGTATVRTALSLDRARSLGMIPDSIEAAGKVDLDLDMRGHLLEPAGGEVDGTVTLREVRVRTPKLRQAVAIENGTLDLNGRRLRTRGLSLRMGESDIVVDAEAVDWLPLALGDTSSSPSVTFDARSRVMDLDALLAEPDTTTYSKLLFARMADRQVDGRPVAEVAEEAGFGLPAIPPMRLEGRYRAGTLRQKGLALNDVDVNVAGDAGRLELTGARFQLMGGAVEVAGRIAMPTARSDAGAAEGYPAVLSFQVRDVGAAPFFDTFTPFRDHLTGSLLVAGTTRLVLDRHLLPVRESVAADGTIAVGGGNLVNWRVLEALGEKLGIAQFDTLSFQDWAGQFEISGPRITLRESVLESGDMRVRTAGSFDFAGTLDLAATLELAPALASRIRGELASQLTAAVAGPDGRIPVGARITGPATGPEVRLDLSRAASNAATQVRQAAEARAREAAEAAAQEAAGKVLPGADSLSIPAAADTARARLQEELRKRLCRITKKCG